MYKAYIGNTVVDALDDLQCVRCFQGSGILRCRKNDRPEGIISTDGLHIWHVDGWPAFPQEAAWNGDTVTLVDISQAEYEAIREALDAGKDLTIFDEEPDEETPEIPTPAQRLAKLEEQLKIAARYASV